MVAYPKFGHHAINSYEHNTEFLLLHTRTHATKKINLTIKKLKQFKTKSPLTMLAKLF